MSINGVFVSDLHGQIDRYKKLFTVIQSELPDILFIGGDILPSGLAVWAGASQIPKGGFISGFLAVQMAKLREILDDKYPEVYIILGNDDGRFEEDSILEGERQQLWHYAHNKKFTLKGFDIYGYSHIPPTPFTLKDWERYDISCYVDPGCISPEEGYRSIEISSNEMKYSTIAEDLQNLTNGNDLTKSVFLFHAPPYKTNLDRCANDGKMIDFVPLENHVGSIAIKRLIETMQPLLTLHGHVHESAALTGHWKDDIGRTQSFTAAHDGPELALIRFNIENLSKASRELI